MEALLLLPPLAFLLMLALVGLPGLGLGVFAPRARKGPPPPRGASLPYACGEDVPDHRAQPDYAQFFPFAFFFTIIHVVALIVGTLPRGSAAASGLAVAFLLAAAVAVHVLLRR